MAIVRDSRLLFYILLGFRYITATQKLVPSPRPRPPGSAGGGDERLGFAGLRFRGSEIGI